MSEQPKAAFGPGSFVWYELCSKDTKAAQAFYSKVLGWKFEPWGPPGAYWMIKAGDKGVGGLMDTNKPEFAHMPSMWSYYIDIEKIDETAGRVEKLGGKILNPPTDIPEVGRFAAILDPAGAMVNIMTLIQHGTEPPCPEPGHFLWVELMSRDFKRAKAFYSELVGWKTMDVPMPDMAYTLFQNRHGNAGGGMQTPPQVPAEVPSHWMGYIHVANIDKTLKSVEAAGGKVLMPAMDVPDVGRMAAIMDPTGATVSLMTPQMPA